MSIAMGPGILTSGLVFDIDMANTLKSWLGKPTTNYVDPRWISWGVDGSGQGSLGTRTILSSYYCTITDAAANTRQSIYVLGLSANTTYTFSVKFKRTSGAPTLRFQLQSYNGGSFISSAFPTTAQLGLANIDDWQTASYTYTTAAGADRVLWFMQDGDDYTTYTHAFELKEPQAELGSFATPFVYGTRSTAQAVASLTGTNNPTATSLTYASNNTFSFDGSYSYLQTTNNCGITGDVTLSAWINPSRAGQTGPHSTVICTDINYPYGAKLMNYKNNSRYGIWLGWAGAGSTNYEAFVGVDINDNTDKMITASWKQSTGVAKIYLNGILQSTQSTGITSAVALINGQITVGTDYNSIGSGSLNKYLGTVYNASVYNRTLSDDEVYQNFCALRGRFGI